MKLIILFMIYGCLHAADYISQPIKTRHGFEIVVDKRDQYVSKILQENMWWQEEIANLLKRLVSPNDNVIHCGAHIGYFDVLIGTILKKGKGKLYSYEASPETFLVFEENIRLNTLENIVTIYNCAVLNECKDVQISYNLENTGNASISHDKTKYEKTFSVTGTTLDTVHAHEYINMIFMDVEGAECLVLEGAEKILSNKPIIIMEFCRSALIRTGTNFDSLFKIISMYNYIYDIIDGEGLKIIDIEYLKQLPEEKIIDILIIDTLESEGKYRIG